MRPCTSHHYGRPGAAGRHFPDRGSGEGLLCVWRRSQVWRRQIAPGWHGTGRSFSDEECLDMVITSALVIDSTGIYKADIGIKDGKISGIGKAGNPQIMDGVTPGMIIGASTEALAGEGTDPDSRRH